MDKRTAAFFDVDGVIYKIVPQYYLRLLWPLVFLPLRPFLIIIFIVQVCIFGPLDVISRTLVTRVFLFLNMCGLSVAKAEARAEALFASFVEPRIFAEAKMRIKKHKARDDRIVLVTASPLFIVRPLADLLKVDDVIAVKLQKRNGRFTGRLKTSARNGKIRAQIVRSYAAEHGIDLSKSFAYADSLGDRHLLSLVGKRTVVNPGWRMRLYANWHWWSIKKWRTKK